MAQREIRVLVVDDDRFVALAVSEHLRELGLEIDIATTATEALKTIERKNYDAVVLDIMMPPPRNASSTQTAGGFKTGLHLAKEIRNAQPDIVLIALTGSQDPEVLEWFDAQEQAYFISKASNPKELDRVFGQCFDVGCYKLNCFIAHGHDRLLVLELKDFLQNTMKLPEPVVLADTPSRGKTIIEKFETYAQRADVVFVLMTPDDLAHPQACPDNKKSRARQNVVFEHGYFLGKLGRHSGKVIVLRKGNLELPSDIAGIIYIDVTNGIVAASEEIRRELESLIDD